MTNWFDQRHHFPYWFSQWNYVNSIISLLIKLFFANTETTTTRETKNEETDCDDAGNGAGTRVESTQLTAQKMINKTVEIRRSSPFSSTSSTASTLSSTKPTSATQLASSEDATASTRKAYFRDLFSLSASKKLCRNGSNGDGGGGDENTATRPNSTRVVAFSNKENEKRPALPLAASSTTSTRLHQPLRVNSNFETIQARQRRVVVMLCVVVVEFFLCWTPIFCIDTMALYAPEAVYSSSNTLANWIGIDLISTCHL